MEERRKNRVLTDADIQAIVEAIPVYTPNVCSLGFSTADSIIIKRHLSLWKKATNIVGTVILTTIAVVIVGIISKGFWASLIEGMKVK